MTDEKKSGTVFSRGTTDEEKKARFSAGAVISVAAMLIGGIFGAIWGPLIARLMGPANMSIVGAFNGLALCLNPLAGLGINTAITTYVSHHFAKNPDDARSYAVAGLQIYVRISIVIVAATAVGMLLMAALHTQKLYIWLTPVMCLTMLFTIWFWGVNGILAGYNRLDLASLGSSIMPFGMLVGSVGLVLGADAVFGKGSMYSVIGGCTGWLFAAVFALVAAFIVYRMQKFYIPMKETFFSGADKAVQKSVLTFGGVAVVATICHAFLTNFSPTVVKLTAEWGWLGGEGVARGRELAGFYSNGYLFASTTGLVIGIVAPMLPSISEAHAHGRHDLVQHYSNAAMQGSFTIVLIFVTGFAVLAGPLVQILNGAAYPAAQAGPVTAIYTAGHAMNMMFYVIIFIFFALKKPLYAAITVPLSLIIQITLLLVLSKAGYRIEIVALAVVASGVVSLVLGIVGMYRIANLRLPAYTWFASLTASIITFAVAHYVFPPVFHGALDLKTVAVELVITLALWFGVFAVLGGLRKRDQAAPEN